MPLADQALTDRAGMLHAAVADAFAASGVGLPGRSYVTLGVPPGDCEQHVTAVERLFPHRGDVASETIAADCPTSPGAVLTSEVLRCFPTVKTTGTQASTPTDAQIEQASADLLVDAVLLWNAAIGYQHDVGCKSVAIEAWEPIGPQGGYAGGRIRIRVSL